MHVQAKTDGSPVTLADKEAEAFIQASLEALLPDIPVIGEEAAALGKLPDIQTTEYFWLVDALDGTKEFIAGGDDYTVNIALVRDKRPVLGVVYAPAQGVLFAGCGPGTAVRWSDETEKDKAISVRLPAAAGLTVAASKSHGDAGKLDAFLAQFKVKKLIKRSSSLKACMIAAGKADLYARFGPTCAWDTAAAQAILESAGGQLTDMQGRPLSYGHGNPEFLNPEFVASSFDWLGANLAEKS